ncbi:MAG: aminotransferase [Mameliella sp.]|nr:aminotransferase [Phaeodactylibacter sp.]
MKPIVDADLAFNTRDLWEKDNKHFIHPYANYEHFSKEGSVIYVKGSGHSIYDSEGRSYLDGMAGLWCVNIGHGREEIAQYMAEQASNLAYYNTFENASSAPAAELAAKLASICPGNLNHVFYGTGGSVANDTAIKIVHYYFNMLGKPNKKKVISRDLGYHGSTYLAHALTGIRSTHIGFDLADNLVHYVSAPYPYRRPDHMSEAAFCDFLIRELEDKILELGADNVACFIAEPILGAGGVIVPPEGYHRRSAAVCKKYGVLYISDEVVTAFGRLGDMVASKDTFEIQPDILILAKGLSSGYIPMGATVISDEIHDVISRPKAENPYFSHGFTYSGHALACGVSLKNIEIMEREDLCGHVKEWGPYFYQRLKTLEELPIVGEVRGSHYMLALEYVKDKATKTPFADEVGIGTRIYRHCKESGLILRPIGSMNILSPPLTYDEVAIDQTVCIVRESILATLDDLKREGMM